MKIALQNGTRRLGRREPGKGLEDFRTPLSLRTGKYPRSFTLAEALLADGRFSEARSYLVNLWEPVSRIRRSKSGSSPMSPRSPRIRIKPFAITGARSPAAGNREPAEQRRKRRGSNCASIFSLTAGSTMLNRKFLDSPPMLLRGRRSARAEWTVVLKVGASGKALAEFEAALTDWNPRQSEWLSMPDRLLFDEGD